MPLTADDISSSSSSYKMSVGEMTTYNGLKNKIEKGEIIDVNKEFISATKFGYQRLVEYFLTLPSGSSRPDQASVNDAFQRRVYANAIEMVKCFLNLPEGSLRPDQATVDEALKIAKDTNNPEMIKCLLGSSALLKSDQKSVNNASKSAVNNKNQGMSGSLLGLSAGSSSPDQASAKSLLERVAEKNDQRTLMYLLDLKEGSLRPDQASVNKALKSAINNRNSGIVMCLLDRPEGSLRPDQATVDEAFKIARTINNPEMIKCFSGHSALPAIASNTSEASIMHSATSTVSYLPSSYVMGEEERTELESLKKNSTTDKDEHVKELRKAAKKGYQAIIEWMLSTDVLDKKCKQWGLDYKQYFSNEAFWSAAMDNQQATMAWMLSLPEGQGRPDKDAIDRVWKFADERIYHVSDDVRLYTLKLILSLPEGQGRPTQPSINRMFKDVASFCSPAISSSVSKNNALKATIKLILSLPEGKGRPGQELINEVSKLYYLQTLMLSLPEGYGRPDQKTVNSIFSSCSTKMMAWMIRTLPEGRKPNQASINNRFDSTCCYGDSITYLISRYGKSVADTKIDDIIGMLNLPEGQGKPDQSTIRAVHGKAHYRKDYILADLLSPYAYPPAPLAIRQNRGVGYPVGRTQGSAFEIHDYADKKVTTNSSSSSSNSGIVAPKDMKLIDAVFENIKARLEGVKLISYVMPKSL